MVNEEETRGTLTGSVCNEYRTEKEMFNQQRNGTGLQKQTEEEHSYDVKHFIKHPSLFQSTVQNNLTKQTGFPRKLSELLNSSKTFCSI